MSPKRDKSVPQLVERYLQKYPAYERRDLRKQIRLENPVLFSKEKNSSYQSNLKKLDRYLGKGFVNKQLQKKELPKMNEQLKEKTNFAFDYLSKIYDDIRILYSEGSYLQLWKEICVFVNMHPLLKDRLVSLIKVHSQDQSGILNYMTEFQLSSYILDYGGNLTISEVGSIVGKLGEVLIQISGS